ncbi:hypothetical protein HDU76_003354 [Blyttiomyces sp. JEL0837]|nr:hypothetical protein HDU76_003354 [Blyttiomyces sp. JEL0837]
MDFPGLIAYGHRLAKYTSPPPPGYPIHFPPIPQDSHMKKSLLYQPDMLKAISDNEDAQHVLQNEPVMEMDVLSKLVSTVETAQEPEHELLDLDL